MNAWLVFPSLALSLLAGCTSPELEEILEPSVAVDVVSAQQVLRDPFELEPDEGNYLLKVVVRLTNQNENQEITPLAGFFEIETDSLSRYMSYVGENMTRWNIAPGGTARLVLYFEIPSEEVGETIIYTPPLADEIREPMLDYEVVELAVIQDEGERIRKLEILATASNEDGDVRKEGSISISAVADEEYDYVRFAGKLEIKLERDTSHFDDNYNYIEGWEFVGNWSTSVTPDDFGDQFDLSYTYVIDDQSFGADDAEYRVTVTATVTKTGQSFSDQDTLYYSP